MSTTELAAALEKIAELETLLQASRRREQELQAELDQAKAALDVTHVHEVTLERQLSAANHALDSELDAEHELQHRLEEKDAELAAAKEREEKAKRALELAHSTIESGTYTSHIAHADETFLVLHNQLLEKGVEPLEFIPLNELRDELAVLIAKTNSEEYTLTGAEEKRLDHLCKCIEINPQARAEKQQAREQWEQANSEWILSNYAQILSYVPPDVRTVSVDELMHRGYSKDLSKRIFGTRCLWLLRFTDHDIAKMHEHDLLGPYCTEGVALDVREFAAILHKLQQVVFLNDDRRVKSGYRERLHDKVVGLRKEMTNNSLAKAKLEHPAYKNSHPLYEGVLDVAAMETVIGDDGTHAYAETHPIEHSSHTETTHLHTHADAAEASAGGDAAAAAAAPHKLNPALRSSISVVLEKRMSISAGGEAGGAAAAAAAAATAAEEAPHHKLKVDNSLLSAALAKRKGAVEHNEA